MSPSVNTVLMSLDKGYTKNGEFIKLIRYYIRRNKYTWKKTDVARCGLNQWASKELPRKNGGDPSPRHHHSVRPWLPVIIGEHRYSFGCFRYFSYFAITWVLLALFIYEFPILLVFTMGLTVPTFIRIEISTFVTIAAKALQKHDIISFDNI